jgi:hypothetical protein
MTTKWSRSSLPHKLRSAFADFLKRRFEATEFFLAQFREHASHQPGMLSEGWNNEIFAARGEGDDPNTPVFGALDPADQALFEEAIHRNTD